MLIHRQRRSAVTLIAALVLLVVPVSPAWANHGPAHENQGKGKGVSSAEGGGASASTAVTENEQCPADMTKVDAGSGSVSVDGASFSWVGTAVDVEVDDGYRLDLCLKFSTQIRTFSLSGPITNGGLDTGDKYDISHIAYTVTEPQTSGDAAEDGDDETNATNEGAEPSSGTEGTGGSGSDTQEDAEALAAGASDTGIVSITKLTDDPTDDVFHFFGPVAESEFTISAGESWVTVLDAASYTVQEATHEGWALVGLTCNDPTGDTVVDLASGLVTVNLAPGETVSCTFLNDPVEVLGIQTTSEDTSGSGEASVGSDTLPFTGFEAREALAMGLVVLAAGICVLALSRKEERSPIA